MRSRPQARGLKLRRLLNGINSSPVRASGGAWIETRWWAAVRMWIVCAPRRARLKLMLLDWDPGASRSRLRGAWIEPHGDPQNTNRVSVRSVQVRGLKQHPDQHYQSSRV